MRVRTASLVAHALALAVAVPGCGTCESPLETGRRIDDGVAPYVERASVEVCVGGARLVDATSLGSNSGACSVSGSSAQACVTGGDCRARESCVCGRCTVQMCRFSSECPPGLGCAGTPRRCATRCAADMDCPAGESCSDGACSAGCSSDAVCARGERCISGRCTALACGPAAGCAPGETCDLQLLEGRVRAPGVLVSGARTILYAERLDDADVGTILRAESSDGVHFTASPETAVVTAAAPATSVRGPSPLALPDGSVALYFALDDGSAIARATSPDGITFGEAEIVLESRDAWEAGRVAAPAVAREGDALLLFYEGGTRAGIGLAISRSGGAFERVSSDPVLTPSRLEVEASWSPVVGVGAPWPVVVESPLGARAIRLFASGDGVVLPQGAAGDAGVLVPEPSIGIAILPANITTAPTLTPSRSGPVLARVRAFEQLVDDDPCVVSSPVWRLYFTSSTRGSISLATL